MMGGLDDAPTMGDTGDLANIVIQDGRAMGTLGHEEEMRRMRKQMVPKKVWGICVVVVQNLLAGMNPQHAIESFMF